MGKKTPFLYVIVSNTSRGIQGGKRPQSTPVRGPLKSFKIVHFSQIRTQNCARFAPIYAVQICFQKLSASFQPMLTDLSFPWPSQFVANNFSTPNSKVVFTTFCSYTAISQRLFPKLFPVKFGLESIRITAILSSPVWTQNRPHSGGFHGQKDPFFLCYCFQYYKGHSGRQITPIDPCQRIFKGFSRTRLSSFQTQNCPVFKGQSRPFLRQFSPKLSQSKYGQIRAQSLPVSGLKASPF